MPIKLLLLSLYDCSDGLSFRMRTWGCCGYRMSTLYSVLLCLLSFSSLVKSGNDVPVCKISACALVCVCIRVDCMYVRIDICVCACTWIKTHVCMCVRARTKNDIKTPADYFHVFYHKCDNVLGTEAVTTPASMWFFHAI